MPLDPSKPAQEIRGNDLGCADYFALSFRLFGPRVSSLFDFYFLLLSVSVIAFVMEFIYSRFMLFILAEYLAIHLFIMTYCVIWGPPIASIANSRTFTGLALLPTLHLVARLVKPTKIGVRSIAMTSFQAVLLAFVTMSRFEAVWEVGVVAAITPVAFFCALLRNGRNKGRPGWLTLGVQLWPTAALILALFVFQQREISVAGTSYEHDLGHHPVWDDVLNGLLNPSQQLFSEFTGLDSSLYNKYAYSDEMACAAVNFYIKIHEIKNPNNYDCDNGYFVYNGTAGDYDALARRIVFRVVWQHPRIIFRGMQQKIDQQLLLFTAKDAFAWPHLMLPIVLLVMSCLAYFITGGIAEHWNEAWHLVIVAILILACASIDPMLAPSQLAIGTLMSYMLVSIMTLIFLILFLIKIGKHADFWFLSSAGKDQSLPR
ncbi:MAG TPA: hypothetical protein VME45_06385 [Stellaceae bacterium]|nr:hypothetical protein [Stellaceae bacterium]